MSELQVVVFSLNGQLFGAEASQVFQIIKYQEVMEISEMPGFIEGVLNYRGTVLPVISLTKRFGFGETATGKKTKIIVSNIEGKLAGFIVNDVIEITGFADENMEPVPKVGGNEMVAFIKKVGKKGDRLISIIELDRVLQDTEIKSLSIEAPQNV